MEGLEGKIIAVIVSVILMAILNALGVNQYISQVLGGASRASIEDKFDINSLDHEKVEERLYWKSVIKCNEASCYKSYIDRYPNGVFKELAQKFITPSKPKQPQKEIINNNEAKLPNDESQARIKAETKNSNEGEVGIRSVLPWAVAGILARMRETRITRSPFDYSGDEIPGIKRTGSWIKYRGFVALRDYKVRIDKVTTYDTKKTITSFDIPYVLKMNDQQMIELIMNSKTLTDKERQHHFNQYKYLTTKQIERLRDYFIRERLQYVETAYKKGRWSKEREIGNRGAH